MFQNMTILPLYCHQNSFLKEKVIVMYSLKADTFVLANIYTWLFAAVTCSEAEGIDYWFKRYALFI